MLQILLMLVSRNTLLSVIELRIVGIVKQCPGKTAQYHVESSTPLNPAGLLRYLYFMSITFKTIIFLRSHSVKYIISKNRTTLISKKRLIGNYYASCVSFPLFILFLVHSLFSCAFLSSSLLNHFRPQCSGGRTAAGAHAQESAPLIPPLLSPWLSVSPLILILASTDP